MAVRRWSRPLRGRVLVGALLALVLVVGLVVVGAAAWQRANRTDLQEALASVPSSTLRVGFTDWSAVRSRLDADLGDDPDREAVQELMDRAYDSDYSAVSSIDESAAALQETFGFSPATAQWEAFAQGRKGATMVLKVAEGSDFDVLAGNLRRAGYRAPKKDDGAWKGGSDVTDLDPTISPELNHIVLLEDRGVVVSSDNPDYVVVAAKAASGDGDSFGGVDGVADLADRLAEPANAMVWGKDFACEDLAMSQADENDQAAAESAVREAGGVSPLAGLAMGMMPSRTLRVVAHFETSDRAERDVRSRAKLAVGDAIGRGGSFADDLTLTSSKVIGETIQLDLRPRTPTGFVLSSLNDGPLLFASC